jgi:hypothetical protein
VAGGNPGADETVAAAKGVRELFVNYPIGDCRKKSIFEQQNRWCWYMSGFQFFVVWLLDTLNFSFIKKYGWLRHF